MFQLIISQTVRERAKLAEHLSSMESDNDLCLENRKAREECMAIIMKIKLSLNGDQIEIENDYVHKYLPIYGLYQGWTNFLYGGPI